MTNAEIIAKAETNCECWKETTPEGKYLGHYPSCSDCKGTGKILRFSWARKLCPCLDQYDGINHYLDATDGFRCCKLTLYDYDKEMPDCRLCSGLGYVINIQPLDLLKALLMQGEINIVDFPDSGIVKIFLNPWISSLHSREPIGFGVNLKEALEDAFVKSMKLNK